MHKHALLWTAAYLVAGYLIVPTGKGAVATLAWPIYLLSPTSF